ncbi:ash family protein [Pectobacterium brasiliense]|uniref:ash family protein n=1 Tax=Pectobacterium brasiliense TaxID=180957 RepID=UPI001F4978FC|nr:ash family protein [Pectobacterium brasiliense]MDY4381296.1 ash family protein [Pectobacterium brasiliense]
MVGWAGAPQGAPVSDEAGKTNSVQSTTRKIGLFGGGDISTHRRLHYGYDHYPNSPVAYCFF